MFYPGKILKLAPADSREDKRKIVRESFQYHFRKSMQKVLWSVQSHQPSMKKST